MDLYGELFVAFERDVLSKAEDNHDKRRLSRKNTKSLALASIARK